jgi:hypothetical protein
VINLGRGGRLERVWPVFLLEKLWRAAANCAIGRKAQERIGFLGDTRWQKGKTLRRVKPMRVAVFHKVLTFLWKKQTLAGNKTL